MLDVANRASDCEVALDFAFYNIAVATFYSLFLVSTLGSVLEAELGQLAVFADQRAHRVAQAGHSQRALLDEREQAG
jgi:hypothetical protein